MTKKIRTPYRPRIQPVADLNGCGNCRSKGPAAQQEDKCAGHHIAGKFDPNGPENAVGKEIEIIVGGDWWIEREPVPERKRSVLEGDGSKQLSPASRICEEPQRPCIRKPGADAQKDQQVADKEPGQDTTKTLLGEDSGIGRLHRALGD